jgi:glycosyltransferase involved in cell wall biosynthesis
MRILLLHQYFLEKDDAGGSRWNEMCKTWSERGHEIHVIAGMMHANGKSKRPEYRGKFYFKKIHENVTVHRTHVSESYNKGFLGRLWGYFSFMFSSFWFGWTKVPRGFDVVVVTSPPLFVGLSGYLLSRINRALMVFEVRDLWPESAIDTGVLTNKFIIKIAYRFERFIYAKSRLINVLTPAFKKKLKFEKGIPESKILFVPNAADFTLSEMVLKDFDREKFRSQHGLNNKFIITYVGAHGVANHLEQILYSAELLKDTNVEFLLIGQGMQKDSLIELRDKKYLDNVRFIDPVPKAEVFKYILASELGASVLKKVDTFKTVYSNKTFDYMSCKTPILMAIDGVSRELVELADAGSYVEPENIHELNRIIRQYIANPKLLQSQGMNGYNYAKANFDRKVLAERYIDSIEKLIHSND